MKKYYSIMLILLILFITGCNINQIDSNKEQGNFNYVAKLIQEGKPNEAYEIIYKNTDPTSEVLMNYINALDKDNPIPPESSLYDIPDDYNGVLADDIKKLKQQYKSKIEKVKKIRENEKEILAKPSNPSIGMTAEEVKNSTWGEPQHINKTTTANTIHEQWVYSNTRYIYLDNGKVTAIQN